MFKAICPDGEFTKDKFVKYFSEMRPDRETETFCAQMFNGFDSDQSGKVSFEEFLLALKLVSNNDPREKLRFAFKMYDIDQNSKLDINELEKLIIGNFLLLVLDYKLDSYLNIKKGINEFSGHKQSNSTGEPKKVARNLLSKFDKDENGKLKIEFRLTFFK